MSARHHRLGTAALFAAAGLLMLGWAQPAQAQVNPFRGYRGPTLPKEDLDLGTAAAARLLNDDKATVGQFEAWAGPASGNEGTLQLERIFDKAGMPCRTIRTRVVYKRTAGAREFTLTACRIPAGQWKLAD